ncbi:acetyl-CoA carboxylase biotin carboxylase subunit family protein [Kitasatospora sp. NPDC088346]|uniref:ATP-grasp domain-containing protein n=1 Tax=Kitasatospora sp. NPDC088346 TaxID=3364073 RepID=UPI003815F85A
MANRRPALLLLGGLTVAWNQRWLDAAGSRGLDLLVLDAPGPHAAGLLAARTTPDHPLAPVADAALIDADDHAALADRAAAWAREYDVRGLCCLREEYVEGAAVVADLLGVRSPGLRAARVCRNKHLQRRYLADWSPASALVPAARRTATAAAWDGFPLVVKPVGRLASSGVRLVADRTALLDSLGAYGPEETLLFEQRAQGPEYSVESLSLHGEVHYLGATEKRTTEVSSDYFVEMGHTTPAPGLDDPTRERLYAVHRAVLDRLAFDTGMAHAEYRIGPDGRIALIEIAARPPGDSIMALHWLATLAPLEDAVVAVALGERPRPAHPQRYARQVYLPHAPGVLAGLDVRPDLGAEPQWFDPAEVRAQVAGCAAPGDPSALRCVVALKPAGTRLAPIRQSGDRAAMFVVDADTPGALDAIEEHCLAAIALRTRD